MKVWVLVGKLMVLLNKHRVKEDRSCGKRRCSKYQRQCTP
jgi:hypothetical protein